MSSEDKKTTIGPDMETIDDETSAATIDYMKRQQAAGGAMDDVGAFVVSFKDFPPRSFPPTFVPANILEETLDDIKDNRKAAQQRGAK